MSFAIVEKSDGGAYKITFFNLLLRRYVKKQSFYLQKKSFII